MSVTKPGQRWFSAVSTVEVIVVKGGDAELFCAGSPMLSARPETDRSAGDGELMLLGKRYADAETGMLVLVTSEGAGPLTVAGRAMVAQETQPLPSSD